MSTPEVNWWMRGENGLVWEQKLPLPEGIADRLLKGYLTRVDADGQPWQEPASETVDPAGPAPAGPAAPAPAAPPALPEPPDRTARKAEWIGYAVRNLGMTPDNAEACTKQDLIEKVSRARGGA